MRTLLKNGIWRPGTAGRVLNASPLLLAGGLDYPENIIDFVRQRLDFYPDEKQIEVLRGGARGIVNCTRQWGKWGQIDGHGGEGRAPGLYFAEQFDFGGDSMRAAERRICPKSGGLCAEAGYEGSD